jgi:GNAT superfamily N-acetyltransferase
MQIEAVDSGPGLSAVRELFVEYAEILRTRHGSCCMQSYQQEIDDLPKPYSPPGGCLLLASLDGRPAGCVGLRAIATGIGEMKRLYVRPEVRGGGVGRRLALALIEQATRLGYHTIRLDTLPTMAEAQALYASLGFVPIDPYGPAHPDGALCFELKVGSAEAAHAGPGSVTS